MDVLVDRCGGLDVHRDTVVATVRVPGSGRHRRAQHTRTFATTTAGITALGVWVPETRLTSPDLLLRRRRKRGMISRWRCG